MSIMSPGATHVTSRGVHIIRDVAPKARHLAKVWSSDETLVIS